MSFSRKQAFGVKDQSVKVFFIVVNATRSRQDTINAMTQFAASQTPFDRTNTK